ncbi:MAG: YfiR/HmsC family protein [Verrucomicrobiota bacterium]|nr:YfiR/HmsC family protein [Verrucomicrobiota bacterium]
MKRTLSLFLAVCLCSLLAHAEDYAAAPDALQTALFLKLLGFDKTLAKDAKLYVLGADGFAAEIKKQVGTPVGSSSMLAQVDGGATLPSEPPNILYIGETALGADALKYAADNKIITISGNPKALATGASLAVVISTADGKPRVLLNPKTSKAEGVDWNPAIMKLATVVQ